FYLFRVESLRFHFSVVGIAHDNAVIAFFNQLLAVEAAALIFLQQFGLLDAFYLERLFDADEGGINRASQSKVIEFIGLLFGAKFHGIAFSIFAVAAKINSVLFGRLKFFNSLAFWPWLAVIHDQWLAFSVHHFAVTKPLFEFRAGGNLRQRAD